jgi:O-antigen ligase
MGFVALIGLSGVTFLACTGIQWDRRKLAMAAAGLALGAALVGKGYRTNLGRLEMASFEDEYLTEGQGRGQYFRQAAPAIAENPITGVGLNNWSYWMTNKYNPYYASRGDYMRPDGTRSTTGDPPAHNYYLLMVTELGWPGLFLCLALLFTWLISNGLAVFNRAEGLHAYLRMGVALSLLGIMMQSWTEWIFLQTHMWFLGHTTLALGAALYYQRQRAVALGRIPKSNVLRLEPAPPVINYG